MTKALATARAFVILRNEVTKDLKPFVYKGFSKARPWRADSSHTLRMTQWVNNRVFSQIQGIRYISLLKFCACMSPGREF